MDIIVLPQLKTGNNAPDFHLPATQGQNRSVGQYRQRKNVVLYFFNNINCAPCRQKLLELKDNYDRLEHLNAVLFGVSHDSIENLANLKNELELPFELLSDVDLVTTKTYAGLNPDKNEVYPSIFVIDRYNTLYSQWLVFEEKYLPSVLDVLRTLHAIEIQCPECGFFPGSTSL